MIYNSIISCSMSMLRELSLYLMYPFYHHSFYLCYPCLYLCLPLQIVSPILLTLLSEDPLRVISPLQLLPRVLLAQAIDSKRRSKISKDRSRIAAIALTMSILFGSLKTLHRVVSSYGVPRWTRISNS